MKRVLFLCSQNSARSQMAEGFLRAFAPDRFEVQSAGTRATKRPARERRPAPRPKGPPTGDRPVVAAAAPDVERGSGGAGRRRRASPVATKSHPDR